VYANTLNKSHAIDVTSSVVVGDVHVRHHAINEWWLGSGEGGGPLGGDGNVLSPAPKATVTTDLTSSARAGMAARGSAMASVVASEARRVVVFISKGSL
jgi:hypothetical protein